MVKLAERDAVAYSGETLGLGIGNDVGRIEKLIVAGPAERTLLVIGADDLYFLSSVFTSDVLLAIVDLKW